jgi:hypothetical protein
MTTRTGARIYRGPASAPLADGACPHCGRVVAINPNGQRRHHQTAEGIDCTGSGVHINDEHGVNVLTELPAVEMPPERRRRATQKTPSDHVDSSSWNGRGNPWSGRADVARRDTP